MPQHFAINDQGSVVGFTPLTPEAKAWMDQNVQAEGWQWMGSTLWVDHRPAEQLIGIIEAEGLTNTKH